MSAHSLCLFATGLAGAIVGLLLSGSTVRGAEKAYITPPSGTNQPANLAPSKTKDTPFSLLDGSSSLGGVLDRSDNLPAVPPSAPDPRMQKELIERLDRKRNFLLTDPSDKNTTQGRLELADPDAPADNLGLRDPRRPQTVLERRLKNGSRTSTTEAADAEAKRKKKEFKDDESESEWMDLDKPREPKSDFFESGKLPSQSALFSSPKSTDLGNFEKALTPETLEDVRSALFEAGGRGQGLDRLSREREDRFLKSVGDISSPTRGLAADATSLGRTRELRSDAADSLWTKSSPVVQKDSSSLGSTSLDPGSAIRSTGLESLGAVGQPNSYAPASIVPSASAPPANKFLTEPRPEPPRFRP